MGFARADEIDMANTTHSVATEPVAQRVLDIVRKIVEDNRKCGHTGSVTLTLHFKDGGIGSCEQQVKTFICIK